MIVIGRVVGTFAARSGGCHAQHYEDRSYRSACR
jgi:hypothetical protein